MCTDIFLNFFHFSYLKNSKNVESSCLNKIKNIFPKVQNFSSFPYFLIIVKLFLKNLLLELNYVYQNQDFHAFHVIFENFKVLETINLVCYYINAARNSLEKLISIV